MNTSDKQSLPWLVMYSNSADMSIVESLRAAVDEAGTTGIHDCFIPLDIRRRVVDGKVMVRKRLIEGHYIFLRATRDDIMRLRENPPFSNLLRFLHPTSDPLGRIYVKDEEVENMRYALKLMRGEVEYFVPSAKRLYSGDYVRVHDHGFDGLRGVLESVKGHEGGRIVVALGDVIAFCTPSIPAENIQLLELAKVTEGMSNSYTSRAYKKLRTLIEDSESLLSERKANGMLCQSSCELAQRLLKRYSELSLNGKMRAMHAEAICNLKFAIG